MTDNQPMVDARNARSGRYRATLDQIADTGVCPFCRENFKWHDREIIDQTADWLITPSFDPYANTAQHLLIIPNRHLVAVTEVTPADWSEISHLIRIATEQLGIAGGAICVRTGEMRISGATVQHLHFHYLVPSEDPVTNVVSVVSYPVGP